MSYSPTKYPHGTFCWAVVSTKDEPKTSEFLTKLFGWTLESSPEYNYYEYSLNGKPVAAAGMVQSPDQPAAWGNFISVDDIEAIEKKAKELGATIVMPSMDVMEQGKMMVMQDDQGTYINFWQPGKHIGAQIINIPNAMSWNELNTFDVEKAKKFYGELLGWTFEAEGDDYTNIMNNGRRNGGIFKLTKEMGDFPPYWVPYFTVANMEESVAKAKELGGVIHMQRDVNIGRIAMVGEPTGAVFMLIEMNVEPDKWEE